MPKWKESAQYLHMMWSREFEEGCRNCGCTNCEPAASGVSKCCDCCCDYREGWIDLFSLDDLD